MLVAVRVVLYMAWPGVYTALDFLTTPAVYLCTAMAMRRGGFVQGWRARSKEGQ